MAMNTFVNRLSIKATSKSVEIKKPTWVDVESALLGMGTGEVSFFELWDSDLDDGSVMTVFGDGKAFHASIIRNEILESWPIFRDETNESVTIGGNFFSISQVCFDTELIRKIVQCFFERGLELPEVKWFTLAG